MLAVPAIDFGTKEERKKNYSTPNNLRVESLRKFSKTVKYFLFLPIFLLAKANQVAKFYMKDEWLCFVSIDVID